MKTIIIFTLLLVLTPNLRAEIVVIGNLDNTLNSLTKRQVQAIFLGRTRSISGGKRVFPTDEEDLRTQFYEKLTSRSIKQIDAYWARLTFSGQSSPPRVISSQQKVIEAVKNTIGKIAYIERELFDESQVKLLYIVN